MKNVFKKIAVIAMAIVMGTGVFAGCKKKPQRIGEGEYTYNDYTSGAPSTWNPHAYQYSDESYVLQYTYMPFYSPVPIPDGEGGAKPEYIWANEMAVSKWVDVTQSLSVEQKTKYGISTTDTMRAFEITVNPNAKWSNGEKIDATDYVESYKRLIDPEMQNRNAASYVSGDNMFVNADKYFNQIQIDLPVFADDKTVVINFNAPLLGVDLYYFYDMFDETDEEYDIISRLEEGYDDGYVIVEEENYEHYNEALALIMEVMATAVFPQYAGYFKTTAFYAYADLSGETPIFSECEFTIDPDKDFEEYDFSNVGIFASNDGKKLTYIFANSRKNDYDVYSSIPSTFLVHTATYDREYTTVGGLKATKYGTSMATTMSYGPYMMTSAQPDKLFVYEKNPNWYGWTDGNHEGQYQTTKINLHVISNNETALQMFLSGKLDNYNPSGSTIDQFRNSKYFEAIPYYYPYSISINSIAADLASIQSQNSSNQDVKNIQILGDAKFRQAFSLALDRATYVLQTPAYLPACAFVLPDLYDDNEDPTSEYRSSLPAMLAVLDIYGITTFGGQTIDRTNKAQVKNAYNAITGFDLTKAKALLAEVYESLPEGVTKDANGKVVVRFRITAANTDPGLSEAAYRYEAQIKNFMSALSAGTNFDIQIKFTASENRYTDFKASKFEAMYGATGGTSPFAILRSYIDPKSTANNQRGVNTSVNITLEIENTSITKTMLEWFNACYASGGAYVQADTQVRIMIAAAIERELVKQFVVIPVAYETFTIVESLKSSNSIKGSGHIIAGTGGMRLKTYHIDDADWADLLKEYNNDLTSIYTSS